MAEKKSISVFERISKNIKGTPVHSFKKIKTDGTKTGAEKAVEILKNKNTSCFEVVDKTTSTKTLYNKLITGGNYEKKVVEI